MGGFAVTQENPWALPPLPRDYERQAGGGDALLLLSLGCGAALLYAALAVALCRKRCQRAVAKNH